MSGGEKKNLGTKLKKKEEEETRKKLRKPTKGVCALFHDDIPQVMYTNKQKKDLGVVTGQAYTVVYATVKYLLYHLYIGDESRHRKTKQNVTINNGVRRRVK